MAKKMPRKVGRKASRKSTPTKIENHILALIDGKVVSVPQSRVFKDGGSPVVTLSMDESTNIATLTTNVATSEESRCDQQQTAEAVQNLLQLGSVNLVANASPVNMVASLIQKADNGLYELVPMDLENQADPNIVTLPVGQKNPTLPKLPPGYERSWVCTYKGCGKPFASYMKLRTHVMTHTGERPYKCKVTGCDWGFTTKNKLNRHMETHNAQKSYKCAYPGCDSRLSTIYNLRVHLRLHERPTSHTCPQCPKQFDLRKKLDQHLKQEHSDVQKAYKCPFPGCQKTFYSEATMGSHKRVHADTRDLTCHFPGCGKKFEVYGRLKQHLRIHTGEKPYVCEFEGCGWAFTTASKLRRHQSAHTGERRYVCTFVGCNSSFYRAEHLRMHTQKHTGVKPFPCTWEDCESSFGCKTQLRKHLYKHETGQLNLASRFIFMCPIDGCSLRFTTKASLRNHIGCHYHPVTDKEGGEIRGVNLMSDEDKLMQVLTEQSRHGGAASATASSGASSSIISAEMTQAVNPNDLISGASEQAASIAAPNLMELMTTGQPVDPNVVNQLLVANELSQNQQETALQPMLLSPIPVTVSKQKPVCTTVKSLLNSDGGMLPPMIPSVSPDLGGGSARTDYHSNTMLSAKAHRRRNMFREKLSLELPLITDSNSDKEKNVNMVITSHGISYQDPETGVMYEQTQLLQDDPPSCDLFAEDTTSAMTNDLPLPVVMSESPTSSNPRNATFTGSTLNLQDLE